MTNNKNNIDDLQAKPPASSTASARKPLSTADLDSLRVPGGLETGMVVEELPATIQIRKPKKQEYVQSHRDWPPMRVMVIRDKANGDDYYIVNPAIAKQLPDDVEVVDLVVTVNRAGEVFLSPLRIPTGPKDTWANSAYEAVAHSRKNWVRVIADMSISRYRTKSAQAVLGDPAWPDLTRDEVLLRGIGDRLIDSMDHPLVQQLQGVTL